MKTEKLLCCRFLFTYLALTRIHLALFVPLIFVGLHNHFSISNLVTISKSDNAKKYV